MTSVSRSIFPHQVQSLSCVWLFVTPWTTAHQVSLSITNSRALFKTHVHWVADAIQPSHPLLSPSPSAFNLSQHQGLFQWVSSSHEMVTAAIKFKDTYSLEEVMTNLDSMFKSRDITLPKKVCLVKAMVFPVVTYKLDCEEGWAPKNWCFWTVVLEKTLESPKQA